MLLVVRYIESDEREAMIKKITVSLCMLVLLSSCGVESVTVSDDASHEQETSEEADTSVQSNEMDDYEVNPRLEYINENDEKAIAIEAAVATFDRFNCTSETYTVQNIDYVRTAYLYWGANYSNSSTISPRFTEAEMRIAGYLMFPDFAEDVLENLADDKNIISDGNEFIINTDISYEDPRAYLTTNYYNPEDISYLEAIVVNRSENMPLGTYNVSIDYENSLVVPEIEYSGYKLISIDSEWMNLEGKDPELYEEAIRKLQGTWVSSCEPQEAGFLDLSYIDISGDYYSTYRYQKYDEETNEDIFSCTSREKLNLEPVSKEGYLFQVTFLDYFVYWYREDGYLCRCRYNNSGDTISFEVDDNDYFYLSDIDTQALHVEEAY